MPVARARLHHDGGVQVRRFLRPAAVGDGHVRGDGHARPRLRVPYAPLRTATGMKQWSMRAHRRRWFTVSLAADAEGGGPGEKVPAA